MKVAIYSPYLDTLGGGEKYMLTIAATLAEKEDVDILLGTHLYSLDTDDLSSKLLRIHGINLEKMNFVKAPIGLGSSALKRSLFLKKYDYFFCLTDGSLFYTTAKHNVLHFQVPFKNIGAQGVKGRIKLSSWEKVIYNSKFTAQIISKYWGIKNGIVVYPPVDVDEIKPLNKKNQIISVGRFHMATRSKKQSIMIAAFKNLSKHLQAKGWSLHLAGGVEDGNEPYIEELKELAGDASVFFHTNISMDELHKLYGESRIYWHAAGYEEEDPTKQEHFGITTVEAMAAGCVPVVINKGGQPEIVTKECGYLWDTTNDLQLRTLSLLKNDKELEDMSRASIERSKEFTSDHFKAAIKGLVYGENWK